MVIRSMEERGDKDAGFLVWLVTCKHVIEDAEKFGFDEIRAQMNKHAEGKTVFVMPFERNGRSECFTNSSEDVAVIPIPWHQIQSEKLAARRPTAGWNAWSRDEVIEAGLSEGDDVFIVGFPVGWRKGSRDYPVVRHGNLAQIQGWLRQEHRTFLVDGSGFPGNSGGPIITKPQIISIEGTKSVSGAYLIGMVSKRELSPSPSVSPSQNKGVSETADLIEVVPMEVIDATIESAMREESLTSRLR